MKKVIISIITMVVLLSIALLSYSPLASTMREQTDTISDLSASYTNCTQESTTESFSTDCESRALDYSGISSHSSFTNGAFGYDGDYSTNTGPCGPTSTCYVRSNYTKPSSLDLSQTSYITYKSSTGESTVAIPSICLNQSGVAFEFKVVNPVGTDTASCYNGTAYQVIETNVISVDRLVEDYITWSNVDYDGNDYSGGQLFASNGIIFIIFSATFLVIVIGVIQFRRMKQ